MAERELTQGIEEVTLTPNQSAHHSHSNSARIVWFMFDVIGK